MKKITTIGGGTGQFALLSALRDLPDVHITAVVSMADSGGSTGRLRDQLGALPPGDVLKALLALSTIPGDVARELLLHRFEAGALSGHNAGNMLLTILSQYSGSFVEAVRSVGELLHIRGNVLPATVGSITLRARLEDGTVVIGETNIDVPNGRSLARIKEVWLEPNAIAFPEAIRAIADADYVLLGPGDLYTSLIPVLLVHGIADALRETHARLILLGNTMTKPGETEGFTLKNFVTEIERFATRRLDVVVAHRGDIPADLLERYRDQGSAPVVPDIPDGDGGRRVIIADLLAPGTLARHDPGKIVKALSPLLE